jgi:16S rRNA (cytosine967-C5)-methyltransferase
LSRIHRPLFLVLVSCLEQVFLEHHYADKVLEKTFKAQRKLGARDRKWVAENFYDIVRWWRRLGKQAQIQENDLLSRRSICWRVGAHFAGHGDLPAFEEFAGFHFHPQSSMTEAEKNSVPDWLYELGQSELGERWLPLLKSLNQQAPVDLRVNTLKGDLQHLREMLKGENIATSEVPGVPGALTLDERKNIFSTKAFQSGFFEVQDRSSQKVAKLVDPQPGERIIDACAGGGGKTLHLAALMKNKGKLISMDIHEWKLEELKRRARRNGIDIVETKVIESKKVIKRQEGMADRVLLDVPCSGLGVLRRNPDAKWKLSLQQIQDLRSLQKQILEDYSMMVKPGGVLVYATCSVLPSENELQVQAFLKQNPDWTLAQQLRLDPDQVAGDGFFAARLLKPS